MSTTIERYGEHGAYSIQKRCACAVCGKKLTRRQSFTQTVNPFNLGADGNPKTLEQIMRECQDEATAWRDEDPEYCQGCPQPSYAERTEVVTHEVVVTTASHPRFPGVYVGSVEASVSDRQRVAEGAGAVLMGRGLDDGLSIDLRVTVRPLSVLGHPTAWALSPNSGTLLAKRRPYKARRVPVVEL